MARLALVAILLLATLPTLGRLAPHGTRAAQDGWAALCTATGLKYVELPGLDANGDQDTGAPAHPDGHGEPDCAYCPLLASLLTAVCLLALLREGVIGNRRLHPAHRRGASVAVSLRARFPRPTDPALNHKSLSSCAASGCALVRWSQHVYFFPRDDAIVVPVRGHRRDPVCLPRRHGGGRHRDPKSAKLLDAVEVRAPELAASKEQALTPGGVTVVDAETFYQRPVNNLSDALRYVPGVWTESGTGGDAVFISSRGSNLDATDYDSNGIKLFQDGLPVTTADGNNHNRFIDPMAARNVSIARGANALTYGASTLGGAIDFVSPTARNSDPRQLSLQGGSDGLRSGRLTLGGVSGISTALRPSRPRTSTATVPTAGQSAPGCMRMADGRSRRISTLRAFATHIDNKQQLAGALTREQFEQDPGAGQSFRHHRQLPVEREDGPARDQGAWNLGEGRRLEFGVSYEDQDSITRSWTRCWWTSTARAPIRPWKSSACSRTPTSARSPAWSGTTSRPATMTSSRASTWPGRTKKAATTATTAAAATARPGSSTTVPTAPNCSSWTAGSLRPDGPWSMARRAC